MAKRKEHPTNAVSGTSDRPDNIFQLKGDDEKTKMKHELKLMSGLRKPTQNGEKRKGRDEIKTDVFFFFFKEIKWHGKLYGRRRICERGSRVLLHFSLLSVFISFLLLFANQSTSAHDNLLSF